MLNIVLFGPPGAGKGTQSEKLISEFQLVHLSTGDILRAEVAAGTELGAEAKKLMDEGILVPDEIVIKMISSKLDQNRKAKGFIFDGFPRTVHQARALDRLLSDKNTGITKMISLKVTDEELTERLLLRGKETGRPDDQNEEIIRTRITEYFDKTAPLEDYYAAQDKFEAIDGIGSINEIFYEITKAIREAQDKREEGLVDSKGETETHKQADESFASKITHIAKVVKDVVSSKLHDVMHPEGNNHSSIISAVKLAKKSLKKIAKKTTKSENEPVSKIAKKAAPNKAAKKSAPKKVSSAKTSAANSAKKVVKKAVKKAVKKTAPKKSVKKVVKKAIKKVTPKKAAKKVAPKKVVKKSAPKKVSSAKTSAKTSAKKTTKKIAAKKIVKKTAKKVIKKSAPKKASSTKATAAKSAKKVVKKAAKKSAPKKGGAKKAAKKGKARRR